MVARGVERLRAERQSKRSIMHAHRQEASGHLEITKAAYFAFPFWWHYPAKLTRNKRLMPSSVHKPHNSLRSRSPGIQHLVQRVWPPKGCRRSLAMSAEELAKVLVNVSQSYRSSPVVPSSLQNHGICMLTHYPVLSVCAYRCRQEYSKISSAHDLGRRYHLVCLGASRKAGSFPPSSQILWQFPHHAISHTVMNQRRVLGLACTLEGHRPSAMPQSTRHDTSA